MGKIEVGILYLGLHNHLIRCFGENQIITRKEFFEKIKRHWLIPKQIRYLVIVEMKEKNLIEIVNRDLIKILPIVIDLEKESNKLYELAGIY